MLQTLRGFEFDNVDIETWFQRVDVSIRTTRSAADPLNVKPQAARLETRRHFFSKCRSLEHGPRSDKQIKNSEQF
jgi:hypothetical protein